MSAYAAGSRLRAALFGVSGAVLLLLFIGIHNAWDAVTYHVLFKKQGQEGERPSLSHARWQPQLDRAVRREAKNGVAIQLEFGWLRAM